MPATLGDALRSAREEKKLSVAEVALRSGVSRAMIADVERGKNVSVDTVEKLARALGVKSLPIGRIALEISTAQRAHLEELARTIEVHAGEMRAALEAVPMETATNLHVFTGRSSAPHSTSNAENVRRSILPPGALIPVRLEPIEMAEVVIAGYVAAGAPVDILNEDLGETRMVPVTELPPDPSWKILQARGDSMTDFGVDDGDLVYAEPRKGGVAASGDIVIGWLAKDGHEGLVIKQWRRRRGVKQLISGNESYEPITIGRDDEWQLQAIVRYVVPRAVKGRVLGKIES
jgi:SOS-response transcriptional repressor LexA